MKVKLDSIDPWRPELHISVDDFPLVIGANSDSDIHLEGRWVSDRHCEISQDNGRLVVRDLHSRFHTLVNDEAVEEVPLLPGDTLTIGIRTFRVSYRRPKSKNTNSQTSEAESH